MSETVTNQTERFAYFDFDFSKFLVKYKSDKDLGNEIEDAIQNHPDLDNEDVEYEDLVKDVMNSFEVEWEIIPCRSFVI